MILVVATIVLAAYVLGSMPWGLLIAKSQGIDIRKHGSGNIGATNVWRVMGKKWGLITFAADMGKGLAAVLGNLWVNDLPPVRLHFGQRGALVAAHEEGIAHHIG